MYYSNGFFFSTPDVYSVWRLFVSPSRLDNSRLFPFSLLFFYCSFGNLTVTFRHSLNEIRTWTEMYGHGIYCVQHWLWKMRKKNKHGELHRVKIILSYVQAVEKGELPHNHEIMRQVTTVYLTVVVFQFWKWRMGEKSPVWFTNNDQLFV
jgi:hypothetical protein